MHLNASQHLPHFPCLLGMSRIVLGTASGWRLVSVRLQDHNFSKVPMLCNTGLASACVPSDLVKLARLVWLRPISLLRSSLLRLLDSTFPGISLRGWEFHPLNLILCLSQNL